MHKDLPRPSVTLVLLTQLFLGALFVVGVGTVVLLPGFSTNLAASLPEYVELRPPLLSLAIAFTVLVLGALAMLMLLVRRIHRGTLLAGTSLLWIDGIVASLTCTVALVAAGFAVISKGGAGSPFLALAQVIACLTLVTLACITLVLRSLLRQAILMRGELDEVV